MRDDDCETPGRTAFLRLYDAEAVALLGFFARRTFDAEVAAI